MESELYPVRSAKPLTGFRKLGYGLEEDVKHIRGVFVTSHIIKIKSIRVLYKHKQITNVCQFASTFGATCGGLFGPVCIQLWAQMLYEP